MLTLTPGCTCRICTEEYGPHKQPHSISCGHVLCIDCCNNIVEKTSPRLSPVCPFCRVQFNSDSIRVIRLDFTTSGWSTPRRFPAMESLNDTFNTEVFQKRTERLINEGASSSQLRVRRLEERVARIAAKKCSVEEVSSLYKELEDFLVAEKDDQPASLSLSAALLRAILMNHLAHSEASKSSKTAEANLKAKIDELELNNKNLESELRRQRNHYAQKSQECQSLRQEINQLKALATTISGTTTPEAMSPRSMSPVSQPTSPPPVSHAAMNPLSRLNTMHARSASMSSRPTTPAMPISPSRSHTPAASVAFPRSHTPAPAPAPPRSHTPGPTPTRSHTPSLRSQTPAARPYTPAPPMPSIPARYATPAPSHLSSRTQTPAPFIPPKPRRLSTPSPPKMMRSTSDDKEAHERWIPSERPDQDYDYQSSKPKVAAAASPRPPSRSGYMSRLRDFAF